MATKEIRQKMWQHIRENARKKGIFVDFVNGYLEHCHCLVSLNSDQTIEKVMQLIKGESSYWINRQDFFTKLPTDLSMFEWQEEYFAVSVSESMIERTRNYIKNQEAHHSKKTFEQEYNELISRYGFQRFDDIPSPR